MERRSLIRDQQGIGIMRKKRDAPREMNDVRVNRIVVDNADPTGMDAKYDFFN